jgi:hypothetical protein
MGVEPEDQLGKIVKIKQINPRSETQAQVVSSIKDEEQEVEALIMPVSNEVTDSGSQQQSVHQLVIVVGPHEPEQVRETEVCWSYQLSCKHRHHIDFMLHGQTMGNINANLNSALANILSCMTPNNHSGLRCIER